MPQFPLPPGYRLNNEIGREAFDATADIWKAWFARLIETDEIPGLEFQVQQKYELPTPVIRELSKTAFTVCFEGWHQLQPPQEPEI